MIANSRLHSFVLRTQPRIVSYASQRNFHRGCCINRRSLANQTAIARSDLTSNRLETQGIASVQSRNMSTHAAIDPDVRKMFEKFRDDFPFKYRDHTWYLTLAAALTALGAPSLVGPLFRYVVHQSQGSSAPEPIIVSNRLRATLFKIYTLTGIAPVLGAFFPLAAAEKGFDSIPAPSYNAAVPRQPGHTDDADGPQPLELDDKNYARGHEFLDLLYQHDLPAIVEGMGRHGPDIMHMERHVIYGLHLADFSVLDAQETELIVFPTLLCGGTKSAGEWHVRGARRVGVEWEDIEQVAKCTREAADWVLGTEDSEDGNNSRIRRQDVVVGNGRTKWVQWVKEVKQSMEQE